MAKYFSDSHVGYSSLPTNSHAGIVMAHRCVVPFPVDTKLVAGDQLVLGVLGNGYTIDSIKGYSDGIPGLELKIMTVDSIDGATSTMDLVERLDISKPAQVTGELTLDAVKDRGVNAPRYLVAEVINTNGEEEPGVSSVSITKGQEIGITFDYRFRQATY